MPALGAPRRVAVYDLLVVGGGPAGAATAAFAARAGLSVLVVDRARFPRAKACSEYLSPEAARDLDALGVLDELEGGRVARLTGMRMVADDGAEAVGRFGPRSAFVPYRPYGLALPRTVLDTVLLRAARRAGAEVREGVAVEEVVIEQGRVWGARLRQAARRELVNSRVLVGADGLNSLVARRLGLARRGRTRRLALVAHLADVHGLGDCGEMFLGRGRYAGLAPIGGGVVNATVVVPAAEAPRIARSRDQFFRQELCAVPELRRRLADARMVRRVMVTGPFARRSRSAIAEGAVLVGDAADFFDPFSGEGIFAALRGGRLAAAAVAAALATGEPTCQALQPYQAARGRHFRAKWVFERLAGLAATRPSLMRRLVRRMARRPALADLWVGAAGDFVPLHALLAPRALAALVA